MASIQEILTKILSAKFGRDVRQAIHDGIEQCYDDVTNPDLNTSAFETAVQSKIDDGSLAKLTIGDEAVTTEKLASKAVVTDKIEDKAITINKIGNDVWDYLQGNTRFSWEKVYTITEKSYGWHQLLTTQSNSSTHPINVKPSYENELLILRVVGTNPPESGKATIPILVFLKYGTTLLGTSIKASIGTSPNDMTGQSMTPDTLKGAGIDDDGILINTTNMGDSIGVGNDIYMIEIPIDDAYFKSNLLSNVLVSAKITEFVNSQNYKPSKNTLTVFSVYGDNVGTSGQYTSKYLFGYCLDNYSVGSLIESSELTSPDNVDPSNFRNMILSGGNPTELSDGAFVFGSPTSGNANLAYGNEIYYLEIPMNVESDLLIQTGGGLIGNYTDVSVEGM